jgi:hypothetical protein
MTIVKLTGLAFLAAVMTPSSASAYVPITCGQTCYYTPPRVANATYGDVLAYQLRDDLDPGLKEMAQAEGMTYEHIAIVSDYAGYNKTQSYLVPGQGFNIGSCGAPIGRPWIHNMLPGIKSNMSVADDRTIFVLKQGGYGGCTGSQPYRIYGLLNDSYNGQCAQFLNDSCGVPSSPKILDGQTVETAKTAALNTIYNTLMGYLGGHWWSGLINPLASLFCGGDSKTTLIWRADWQLINELIHTGGADQGYQVGGGYDNYNYAPVASQYTVPAWPDGIVQAWSAAHGNVQPAPAAYQQGYYTCYDNPCDTSGQQQAY